MKCEIFIGSHYDEDEEWNGCQKIEFNCHRCGHSRVMSVTKWKWE